MNRLSIVSIFILACADPAGGPPDARGTLPDSDPPVDVALPTDVAPDSTSPEPSPAVGAVTVYASSILGVFAPATWIVVNDRHGDVWTVVVPAGLRTTVMVPDGASVTLLQRDAIGELRRTTFIDVEPGDVLQTRTALVDYQYPLTLVRFPLLSSDWRSYELELAGSSRCRSRTFQGGPAGFAQVKLPVYDECVDPGLSLLVVKALEADGKPVATLFQYANVSNTLIDLTNKTWSPVVAAQVEVTGAPPTGGGDERALCLRAWVHETEAPLANMLRRALTPICAAIPDADSSTLTFQVPSGLPVVWEKTVTIPVPGSTAPGSARFDVHDVQLSAAPSGTFDLSWAATPMPTVDVDPQGPRPSVRIAGALDYLGGVTRIRDAGLGYGWLVVHPRTASFQLPALPAAFAPFELADGGRSVESRLYLPGQFTTYTELRNRILPRPTQDPMEQRSVTIYR